MKMVFEVYNGKTDADETFEAEVNDGLNRLMATVNGGDGSLNGDAGEIYGTLRSSGVYVASGIWKVVGMTHREFIREFGLSVEDYHETIDGWLDAEYADEHLDSLFVTRYMLFGDKPFREVYRMYDEACGLGDLTMREWLGERAMPDDFGTAEVRRGGGGSEKSEATDLTPRRILPKGE